MRNFFRFVSAARRFEAALIRGQSRRSRGLSATDVARDRWVAMPDPISSYRSPQATGASDFDPHADDVGMMSRADAPNSCQAQPDAESLQEEASAATLSSVPKLVSSVPPAPSALPAPSPSPTASTALNNAQRTEERRGVAPYLSAGTAGGGETWYVGAALLKGRDASGAAIEFLSGSVQVGAQSEAQLGFQRIAGNGGVVSGSVETFTARANMGIHNDDGSLGWNVGAGVTAVGFEVTIGEATSLTYGVGAGFGAGASLGARDSDGDGKTEFCGRASAGPVTVGVCLEDPR